MLYAFFWLYAGTKVKKEDTLEFACGFLIGLIGILPNLTYWFNFRVLEAAPLDHAQQLIFLDLFIYVSLLMPFLLAHGISDRHSSS